MEYQKQFQSLENKRVLITGASGSIGSCIAEIFASYGAYLGLHYNSNEGRVKSLLDFISKTSGKGILIQGDLLDPVVRKTLVGDFIDKMDRIDILINNAGSMEKYKHFSEISEEDWDRSFDLNLKAPFFLMSSAVEYMKNHGGGKIINISSANVKYGGSENSFHYISAKASLENLTIGFSRYGANYNILINSIRAGLINTQMRYKTEGYNEENFKKRIELIPLKRSGLPLDIANMALFLASDTGNFITGQIYAVSGGD